jgi:hypothetical protein
MHIQKSSSFCRRQLYNRKSNIHKSQSGPRILGNGITPGELTKCFLLSAIAAFFRKYYGCFRKYYPIKLSLKVKYCFSLQDKHHRYIFSHFLHKIKKGEKPVVFIINTRLWLSLWAGQNLKIHTRIVINQNKQQETNW